MSVSSSSRIDPKRSKGRRLLTVLVLVVVGLAGAFGLGELTIRVLRLQGDQLYERDRRLGWVHRPDYSGLYVSPQARNRVRFDRHGLVGPDREYEKPAGTRRILLIGDSFTESIQVPYETSWAHRLEAELGAGWEVLNAGVAGYGTDNALLYFREDGRRYAPDVVFLLFFTGNDVSDNDVELYRRIGDTMPKPFFALEGDDLRLRDYPLPPFADGAGARLKGWVRNHSRFYLFVRDRLNRIQALARHRRSAVDGVPLHWRVYREEPGPEFDRAWRITAALLDELRDDVQAAGAVFAVGSIPTGWRIEPEQWGVLTKEHPSLISDPGWDLAAPDRRLREILDHEGIPFCDLEPDLRVARATGQEPLYGDHLTGAGHAVAADAVAAFMRERILPLVVGSR